MSAGRLYGSIRMGLPHYSMSSTRLLTKNRKDLSLLKIDKKKSCRRCGKKHELKSMQKVAKKRPRLFTSIPWLFRKALSWSMETRQQAETKGCGSSCGET